MKEETKKRLIWFSAKWLYTPVAILLLLWAFLMVEFPPFMWVFEDSIIEQKFLEWGLMSED